MVTAQLSCGQWGIHSSVSPAGTGSAMKSSGLSPKPGMTLGPLCPSAHSLSKQLSPLLPHQRAVLQGDRLHRAVGDWSGEKGGRLSWPGHRRTLPPHSPPSNPTGHCQASCRATSSACGTCSPLCAHLRSPDGSFPQPDPKVSPD